MTLRIDYTAGNIFDLDGKNFKVTNDHALASDKRTAHDMIVEICRHTKASPEDFLVTDLETGKKGRFRSR